jgi:hypothetical protein
MCDLWKEIFPEKQHEEPYGYTYEILIEGAVGWLVFSHPNRNGHLFQNLICSRVLYKITQFGEMLLNEEPARMTQKTALRSIIPKDVMTSLLSLLTSNRRKICVQYSTEFWQKKT